ncbi:MAG: hypothetical protein WBH11_13275 [Stenotrophomonas geniculata]
MIEAAKTHTVERLSREPRRRSITVISKAQLTPTCAASYSPRLTYTISSVLEQTIISS